MARAFFLALTISLALSTCALAQKPKARPLSSDSLYEEIGRQVEHCIEVNLAGGKCEVRAYVVAIELPPPPKETDKKTKEPEDNEA
ncbi:MAG: hypothetical protein HN348_33650, partial [Proteobacteria bacterium]|nr:hypothetical protein [Pseudomonadota bacterium]